VRNGYVFTLADEERGRRVGFLVANDQVFGDFSNGPPKFQDLGLGLLKRVDIIVDAMSCELSTLKTYPASKELTRYAR
jgi:hypothetical protein